MKKEYIFPITEISDVEIMNMICVSPFTGDDEEEDEGPGGGGTGGSGEHIHARCRNDYGSDSDFGSLW